MNFISWERQVTLENNEKSASNQTLSNLYPSSYFMTTVQQELGYLQMQIAQLRADKAILEEELIRMQEQNSKLHQEVERLKVKSLFKQSGKIEGFKMNKCMDKKHKAQPSSKSFEKIPQLPLKGLESNVASTMSITQRTHRPIEIHNYYQSQLQQYQTKLLNMSLMLDRLSDNFQLHENEKQSMLNQKQSEIKYWRELAKREFQQRVRCELRLENALFQRDETDGMMLSKFEAAKNKYRQFIAQNFIKWQEKTEQVNTLIAKFTQQSKLILKLAENISQISQIPQKSQVSRLEEDPPTNDNPSHHPINMKEESIETTPSYVDSQSIISEGLAFLLNLL